MIKPISRRKWNAQTEKVLDSIAGGRSREKDLRTKRVKLGSRVAYQRTKTVTRAPQMDLRSTPARMRWRAWQEEGDALSTREDLAPGLPAMWRERRPLQCLRAPADTPACLQTICPALH
jgi:hypothetical protein